MAAHSRNQSLDDVTDHGRNSAPSAPKPLLSDPAILPAVASTTASASFEALKDITYGSLAGICGKVVEYPFDTVKVRLQSHIPSASSPPYRGPVDCFIRSYREDGGIRSLYRGISAPLVGAAMETSSLFFGYRIAQEAMIWANPGLKAASVNSGKSQVTLPFSALLVCGAASGAFTSLILTPIELVKCRMQVPGMATKLGYKAPTPLSLIASIFRHEGLLGFWHGQLGTLIRETGGSAAWFGSYEAVCSFFKTRGGKPKDSLAVENGSLPLSQQLLAGAAAGMSYNFVFYPADTIKSRMQTQGTLSPSSLSTSSLSGASPPSISGALTQRQTFLSTAGQIYQQAGFVGFYRGCGITVARAAPSSAIIFAIYEGLRSHFG